jgi:hypothetical protein
MIIILIASFILVLVMVAESKSLKVKLLKMRLEKDLMEHDLHELSMLANGKDDLPVTQPYLRNPDAIKISFEIIRLRLRGAQLKNDLKNLGRVEE